MPAPFARIRPYLQLLRPAQWIKNVVVFAPAFFSLWNADSPEDWTVRLQTVFGPSLLAFAAFCLLSSAVYILNDLIDAPRDRLHPRKRHRPIASGAVTPVPAGAVMLGLTAIHAALLFRLPLAAVRMFAAYFLLQICYMCGLKHLPVLDVVCIAAGFALRVIAGGFAAGVSLSPWLLACTFLLSLFLALCKRRQEKAELGDNATGTRPSIARLPLRALDNLVNASAAATLLCYAAYTQAPATVEHFGSRWLILTLPLVAAGIARYLFLLRRRDEGDRPERVLLTDWPLLLVILLFGIAVAATFVLRPAA